MSQIQENLLYTKEHEWVKVEGDVATIGITDFAQSSLGDIVFVELPDSGESLEKEQSFGVVESIKSVSDLYSPVTGEVVDKNSSVEDTPESVNENAYDAWLIKLKVSNSSELETLMDAQSYKNYCENG